MKTNNILTTLKFIIVFVLLTAPIAHTQKLNADKVEFDKTNGDAAFRARNMNTKKWGMFQGSSSGKPDEMIPMKYDKIDFFEINASFTGVYKGEKVGIYLCKWSYEDKIKQTVPCLYEDYKRMDVKPENYDVMAIENTTEYLAMKKNGKWGWVDWMTGEEKSKFIYNSPQELPKPTWQQFWMIKNVEK